MTIDEMVQRIVDEHDDGGGEPIKYTSTRHLAAFAALVAESIGQSLDEHAGTLGHRMLSENQPRTQVQLAVRCFHEAGGAARAAFPMPNG